MQLIIAIIMLKKNLFLNTNIEKVNKKGGRMLNKLYKNIITLILVLTVSGVYCEASQQKDIQYKKDLIKSSGNPNYTLKNMEAIIGEEELAYVIKKYDKYADKYISDTDAPGDQKGVTNKTIRAGLHNHTTYSDGSKTVEERLDEAAAYAKEVKKVYPKEKYPFIIAITDHYNTEGCRKAVDLIQKNPEKYKDIKIVLGMEGTTEVKMPSQKEAKTLHMLFLAINPYEEPFKDMKFKKAMEWWDTEDAGQNQSTYHEVAITHDYKTTVINGQKLKYGLIGIAHPLRYFDRDETIYKVIDELFKEFSFMKRDKMIFTEGYYQPYKFNVSPDLYRYTYQLAEKYGIYRTGSQDSHGPSIFAN